MKVSYAVTVHGCMEEKGGNSTCGGLEHKKKNEKKIVSESDTF